MFAIVEIIDSVYFSESNLAPALFTDSPLKQYKAGGGLFALHMVRPRIPEEEQ
jgi:hypothetical protein